jgi:4-carboxymuconolactone decarboxylase
MADRRFPLIPVENLTADQKVVYDAIKSGPRSKIANTAAAKAGPLGGPFNIMLRSPAVGNLVQALGGELRFKSSIPSKLNELAIMVTARYWTSQYEWYAHCRLAIEAGLDPAKAKDVAENRRPANMDDDEAMIYDFSRELHETKGVSDANFERIKKRFGEQGLFDLIAVNGYYSLVSMILNVDKTPLPEGVPTPLK